MKSVAIRQRQRRCHGRRLAAIMDMIAFTAKKFEREQSSIDRLPGSRTAMYPLLDRNVEPYDRHSKTDRITISQSAKTVARQENVPVFHTFERDSRLFDLARAIGRIATKLTQHAAQKMFSRAISRRRAHTQCDHGRGNNSGHDINLNGRYVKKQYQNYQV